MRQFTAEFPGNWILIKRSRKRRRNKGYHEGEDDERDTGHFMTPQFDANAHLAATSGIEHMKLTLDDDCPYPVPGAAYEDSDEDPEEDEEQEQARFCRGRSRSRSLHSMDEDPATGVLLLDEHAIAAAASSATEHAKPIEVVERSGPLPSREVETLKKGVEEAMPTKDSDAIREEREEQLAAEEERKQRVAAQLPSSSTDTKRVKILMLGDSGVGKSSLIIRWTADTFSTDLVGTVGVNFKTRRVTVNGENVQAQVWDTAGQEQFHKITTSYYKGANGIMLVYDVSDRKSVDNVEYWVKNIKSHASDSVSVALIGNKVDLRKTKPGECCDTSHGQQFAAKFGVPYFETSAKDSTNVELAFQTLIAAILANSESTSASGENKSLVKSASVSGDKTGTGKKEKCIVS